ncbi:MAG: undecaprenyl-phosphate glucose phosphotransferase [Gammaproteobacteria bacterium]|nr:undecaprenyl-phosphate glucose phosphotransferase [Gammaproteobacteria bacterium]
MIEHRLPGIHPHHSVLSILFRVMDMLIIGLSLWFWVEVYSVAWSDQYAIAMLLTMALFILFAESMSLYDSQRMPVLYVWVLVCAGLLVAGYTTKSANDFSQPVMELWLVGTPLVLVLYRSGIQLVLSNLRAHGYSIQTVAIVGANENGNKLAQYIQHTPALSLRLLGFFDDRQPISNNNNRFHPNLAAPFLGSFCELIECARTGRVGVIYIVLPLKAQERISQLIQNLADTPAAVYLVPDFFVFDLLHARWINIGNMPTISVFETPLYGVYGFAKRSEDLILSTLILILIALPMLAIAIGVKCSSPGPMLFRQTRYGLDGRKIKIWKFRTMTVCEDGEHIVQARPGDQRVTPFGAFLRRTSLDELPQFINVLTGQMSIVGPRPHAVAHNEIYRKLIPGYMLRHRVKPGITGWAQINGWRGETDCMEKMQKRVEYDLWYIRQWSLRVDLKIIGYTALNVLWDREAY